MYNYKQEQFKEIIENGIYWMANPELADLYVKELNDAGYDFHVIHNIGSRDVIFMREKAQEVYLKLINKSWNLRQDLKDIEDGVLKALSLLKDTDQ
jgi:hypothetical protein